MGKIDVVLNGNSVSGSEGMSILELAQENGVDIPTLCYIPELTPTGSCRMCVVEVTGSRTLVASCHTPIQPNMDIHTHSPKVLKARRVILELLFASHPDSCLVCDKANLCELRKIAADLGFTLPRIRGEKRYYPIEELGPNIVRDLTKCIMCRRCVRACRELKGEGFLGIALRGFESKIIADNQELIRHVCESCDVCVQICPVGALAKKEEGAGLKKKKGTPVFISG